MLNENEELQPYLNPNPFTRENIELSFSFHERSGAHVKDGPVAHVFYGRKEICYSTHDTFKKHLKTLWDEPYEAAAAVVRGERPDDLRELYSPNGSLVSPRVVVMRAFFGNARKKYNFRSPGGDVESYFNMEQMSIVFKSSQAMTPKEARAILTELVDDLWSRVGETKAVREGLTKEKFINERLLLAILFEDKWGVHSSERTLRYYSGEWSRHLHHRRAENGGTMVLKQPKKHAPNGRITRWES